MNDDQERIVEAARRGDRRAFNALVQQFQGRSIAYAYNLLGDFEMAEDVAQDCLLEAYRGLQSLEFASAFSGWLHTIIMRRCSRLLHRKQVATVSINTDGDQDVYRLIATVDLSTTVDTVDMAIGTLPEAQQTVIRLYYIDGHSQEEIGRQLNITTNTVKKRLQAARRLLRTGIKSIRNGPIPGNA